MRGRFRLQTSIVISAVLCCGTLSYASTGVAISPSEVIVGNLATGASYDLYSLGGMEWNVQNRNSAISDIVVSSISPEGSRIPDGYEPIPDPAWLVPSTGIIRDMGSMDAATISVTIQLPGGDDYAGKKYAGIIEAKSAPGGSAFGIGVAARARILFSVKSAAVTAPSAANSNHGLTISTTPYIIDAGNVTPGQLHKSGQNLKITNPNNTDIQVRLEQITLEQSQLRTAQDCESLPDGSFIVFENRTVSIPAGETTEVPIYIALPAKEEYRGRKYAIVVYTSLAKSGLAVGTYTIVKFNVE